MEGLGCKVTAMSSAEEALSTFTLDPQGFDLAITDFTMPGINGVELAKALRSIRPGFPIILASGYNPELSPTDAQETGFKGYLPKPYDKPLLSQLIEDALGAPPENRGA